MNETVTIQVVPSSILDTEDVKASSYGKVSNIEADSRALNVSLPAASKIHRPPLQRAHSDPALQTRLCDGSRRMVMPRWFSMPEPDHHEANTAFVTVHAGNGTNMDDEGDILEQVSSERSVKEEIIDTVTSVKSFRKSWSLAQTVSSRIQGVLAYSGARDEELDDVEIEISRCEVMPMKTASNSALDKGRLSFERREIIKDKLSYVTCSFILANLTYLVFAEDAHFNFMCTHTGLFISFMLLRYWQYRQRKWQYFMMDYCYVVNWSILGWFFFLREPWIFVLLYALSYGSVLWAVLLFQNSLVLHSIDKFISCYIHVMPAIIMMKFRWYNNDFHVCLPGDDRYALVVGSNCPGIDESGVLGYLYGCPILAYVGHFLLQNLITAIHPILRNDPEYLTAYRLFGEAAT